MPAGREAPKEGTLMRTTPTIWCTIQCVQPLHSWRRAGVAVTVADREGTAVTMVLRTSDLATYASFQAAVLRATGHPFRYLPGTARQASALTTPAWLERPAGHRPRARLEKLMTMPRIVKGMVKRALASTSAVAAK
jgi:hypothetical protein